MKCEQTSRILLSVMETWSQLVENPREEERL